MTAEQCELWALRTGCMRAQKLYGGACRRQARLARGGKAWARAGEDAAYYAQIVQYCRYRIGKLDPVAALPEAGAA